MKAGLDADIELEEAVPLYRILDFFSVADMLLERRLYVPSAARFEDQNEGIEELLAYLDVSSGPCSRRPTGFGSRQEAESKHLWWKSQHYVSSWSRTRDSVAMWALYSRDCCSVQVRTTVGSLRRIATKFHQANHVSLAIADAPGSCEFITYAGLIDVGYASIQEVHRRIERRARAYLKLEQAGRTQQQPAISGPTHRDLARAAATQLVPFGVKDASFQHEAEVRLLFRACSLEAAKLQDVQRSSASAGHYRWNKAQRLAEIAAQVACTVPSPFRHVDLGTNFVDGVIIDPRCPPHKRAFMEGFFYERGISVDQSEAFGYLPAQRSFGLPRSVKAPNSGI